MNRQQRRAAGSPSSRTADSPLARAFEEATAAHRSGRLVEAEPLYRRILAADPDHAGALAGLGRLALQAGHADTAVALFSQAILRDKGNAAFHNDAGLALARQGNLDAARVAHRRAAALQPAWDEPHSNLAFLFRQAGQIAEAVRSFERAATLAPKKATNHVNLGMALEEIGAVDKARTSFTRALACDPGLPQAHLALASLLESTGDLPAALEHGKCAVAAAPKLAPAHLVLGNVLAASSSLAQAESAYRHALALWPSYREARANLGSVLHEQGRLDEALTERERAIADAPDNIHAVMQAATAQLYRVGATLSDIGDAAARCGTVLTAKAPRPAAPCIGSGQDAPRLGFLSGDFRTHAAGILVLPTLEALSRAGHRITCYSTGRRVDALTDRFRAAATSWRDLAGLPDATVVEQIRADRIDILFDLAGYTAGNCALALAARAAPLQIGWAGYPGTLGLATLDYLLGDRHQTPPASDRFYRESIIRMPHSYVCHEPPSETPDPGPPPSLAVGHVTFGSFNAAKKISAPVIVAWSQILAALPQSRMRIKASAFDCPDTRLRYAEAFAAKGIATERLDFLGSSSRDGHLAAMATVDLVLDCFPYSGGVTTLECLWMGLPVIALPGDSLASRHSLGYLAAVGLDELVAGSTDDYVARAVALAGDRYRIAALRTGLRARMLAAPLCDAERFRTDLERACALIWQRHRAGLPPAALDIPAPV